MILVNGGACFVPARIVAPYLDAGRLHLAPDRPRFRLPAYVVYPSESDPPVLEPALEIFRAVAAGLK